MSSGFAKGKDLKNGKKAETAAGKVKTKEEKEMGRARRERKMIFDAISVNHSLLTVQDFHREESEESPDGFMISCLYVN